MRYVINRKEWGVDKNGKAISNSCLMDTKSRRKCCLGFVGLQHGFSEHDIANAGMPAYVAAWDDDGDFVSFGQNTQLSLRAAEINDCDDLDAAEKEDALVALFREHGHELVFEGEYAK